MMIAKISPTQAAHVRNSLSAKNLMTVNSNSKIARNAVTIAGPTPISRLKFVSRIACQTIIAMASRPAIQPDAVPHAHAGLAEGAEIHLLPIEEGDDQERDGRGEDDLGAVIELCELVHPAVLSSLNARACI